MGDVYQLNREVQNSGLEEREQIQLETQIDKIAKLSLCKSELAQLREKTAFSLEDAKKIWSWSGIFSITEEAVVANKILGECCEELKELAKNVHLRVRDATLISHISYVHPKKGLVLHEKAIDEFTDWPYLKFLFFLWNGREGSMDELTELNQSLMSNAKLPNLVEDILSRLPKDQDPMITLQVLLPLLAMKGTFKEQQIDLMAKIPGLINAIIFHQEEGRIDLGDEKYKDFIRFFNIVHAIHGAGNASCFASLVTSCTKTSMAEAAASMAATLHGELHGGANIRVIEQLEEWPCDEPGVEYVKAWIKDKIKTDKLYGYGHPIIWIKDPRAQVLGDKAKELFPDSSLVKRALYLEKIAPEYLKEIKPSMRNPYPNVDAFSGPLAVSFGIPKKYLTLLFFMARFAGNSAEIVANKEFFRPKDVYLPPEVKV